MFTAQHISGHQDDAQQLVANELWALRMELLMREYTALKIGLPKPLASGLGSRATRVLWGRAAMKFSIGHLPVGIRMRATVARS